MAKKIDSAGYQTNKEIKGITSEKTEFLNKKIELIESIRLKNQTRFYTSTTWFIIFFTCLFSLFILYYTFLICFPTIADYVDSKSRNEIKELIIFSLPALASLIVGRSILEFFLRNN